VAQSDVKRAKHGLLAMDDQSYSASALDHSLDDEVRVRCNVDYMRAAHCPTKGLDDDDAHHHATSSLFDLFDGVHAEHSQQALTFPFS
jgi:hypothetical protein